jgi:hypothetical protein
METRAGAFRAVTSVDEEQPVMAQISSVGANLQSTRGKVRRRHIAVDSRPHEASAAGILRSLAG